MSSEMEQNLNKYYVHAFYKFHDSSVKRDRNLSAEDVRNIAKRELLVALPKPVNDTQSTVLSDPDGIITKVIGSLTNGNAIWHAKMASSRSYSFIAEGALVVS